jgi:protein-L-isoaspartate(D-aspartate) O-methyltransferase
MRLIGQRRASRPRPWRFPRAVLRASSRRWAVSSLLALVGCGDRTVSPPPLDVPSSGEDLERRAERERMVEHQLRARGVGDERVLAALRKVPRHRFVPEEMRAFAYEDGPLPIGLRQTISQPYVVAFMSAALELQGDERVLEVGSGSGYQAAILSELAREVFTIEILPALAERARATLEGLGYPNVHVRCGDGYLGWPEEAPFDAIMVTAAPDHVPEPLLEQLAVGGRMILPVGTDAQELVLIRRTAQGYEREAVLPVRFVPMTGLAEEEPATRPVR